MNWRKQSLILYGLKLGVQYEIELGHTENGITREILLSGYSITIRNSIMIMKMRTVLNDIFGKS